MKRIGKDPVIVTGFGLTPPLITALKRAAKRDGLSMSEIVRRALDAYFKRET